MSSLVGNMLNKSPVKYKTKPRKGRTYGVQVELRFLESGGRV